MLHFFAESINLTVPRRSAAAGCSTACCITGAVSGKDRRRYDHPEAAPGAAPGEKEKASIRRRGVE
jgi:hypothetical protein